MVGKGASRICSTNRTLRLVRRRMLGWQEFYLLVRIQSRRTHQCRMQILHYNKLIFHEKTKGKNVQVDKYCPTDSYKYNGKRVGKRDLVHFPKKNRLLGWYEVEQLAFISITRMQ